MATSFLYNHQGGGFSDSFLGNDAKFKVPLPTVSERQGQVEKLRTTDGNLWSHHFRHSTMMNAVESRRTAIVCAANLRSDLQKGVKSASWKPDNHYKDHRQLNGDYFEKDEWDIGHLVMRYHLAWGSRENATMGSKSTYFWTNAAIQHGVGVNRDEILDLENMIIDLLRSDLIEKDKNGHGAACLFVGPIYDAEAPSEEVLYLPETARGDNPVKVRLPNAFFHVVVFRTPTGLCSCGFVVQHTNFVISNKDQGATLTCLEDIQKSTGLKFAAHLIKADIMKGRDKRIVHSFKNLKAILSHSQEDVQDEEVIPAAPGRVALQAAMVDPLGTDRGREWVRVVNLLDVTVAIHEGSTLEDPVSVHRIKKQIQIAPNSTSVIRNLRIQLNNSGDVLELRDPEGRLIHQASYTQRNVRRTESGGVVRLY